MPRKVLDVRKECVRLSCQRQTKSPSGLSVGGLFAYRHAPESLRSRTPWNKSSAYVSDTHYQSEIFKSVILSVLYHIRHFNVFVVKRKTLTFDKVYRLCYTPLTIRLHYNYTTGSWQIQGHRCDRNVQKCDVVVTSMIISYADEKREWVEIGFAWIFDVFRE